MRASWILLSGVVAILAAVYVLDLTTLADAQQASAPVPVTVAQPFPKKITEWDEFTGRFEAVERVDVRARVSGFLEQVKFKDGDIVQKGDLLFLLDREPFEIAVDLAKAQVDQALAQLELATNDVERARPLVATGALTPRELETRLAAQRETAAKVEEAKARLGQAKLNLRWTEVRAPIAGRISDARIDSGNLITGGQADATLLTTIVTLSPIHFVFEGSEADYLKYQRLAVRGKRASSRVRANPVVVKLADETGFFHRGAMEFVDNVLDTRSGTIRARAIFENNEAVLLPGLFGRLRLFGGEIDALLIPDSAIASDQAKKIVFAVGEDGTVMQKTVTLGPLVEGLRVIKSGLRRTDRIVINGIQRARPGQKVTPQEGRIEPQTGVRN